jgi:RNA 3'-terminal phosphate cyclase
VVQHLTGLQLVARLASGTLEGGKVGSLEIVMTPGTLHCQDAVGDTGTAGSCTLLAQVGSYSTEEWGLCSTNITLEGGEVGSMQIVMTPGTLHCQDAVGDTGTAGSCTLLPQVGMPARGILSPMCTKEHGCICQHM